MTNHETIISFPGLGIGEFSVNSVAFTVFGISIAWYGIIIVLGMVAAFAYAAWRAKKSEGISFDDMLDYAIFLIISGIVGARLYYVAFHGGVSSFGDLINLRSGGLAIYGGVIGGAIAAFIVTKVKKLSFAKVTDAVLPGVMIAQAIGRWGNFMNGEAHGGVTELPWRMGLRTAYSDGTIYVHPTFLYESLWNVIGFILLNIAYKKKKFGGEIALMYVIWYGIGRTMIEGLRTDSLYIGGSGIRVSQLLAALSAAVALIALLLLRHRALTSSQTAKAGAASGTVDDSVSAAASVSDSASESDGAAESVETADSADNGVTADGAENAAAEQSDDEEENGTTAASGSDNGGEE